MNDKVMIPKFTLWSCSFQDDLNEFILSQDIYLSILVGKINLKLAYVSNEVSETNVIDVKWKKLSPSYIWNR